MLSLSFVICYARVVVDTVVVVGVFHYDVVGQVILMTMMTTVFMLLLHYDCFICWICCY